MFPMHRSYGLQGSLKRRYKHPSPTSINGYHTAKKLLSQSPAKRPTFAFADESGYTLAFANRIAHKGLHGETGGVSDGGWYHYPRYELHVHEHPRAGYQNGVLCRFWVLVGDAPEERRKPSEQRCAYARRCSEGVAAPLGCVIFSLLPKLRFVHPALRAFCVCEAWVVSLPSARFTCC